MHKLLVFDLDGTLAEVGKGMSAPDAEKLIELEQSGYTIAICSGKPVYYLCGFARQLGLEKPILIGENGAVFQFGIGLPPKRYGVYPYNERAKMQRDKMRELIDRECRDKVWYQPNEAGLTPFPKDEETFELLQKMIDKNRDLLDELQVYRHCDCFDLIPKNINKFNGLAYLVEQLGLKAKDVIAIGDGVNDIPMFQFADLALGITGEEASDEYSIRTNPIIRYTDKTFVTIGQVLDYIKEKKL